MSTWNSIIIEGHGDLTPETLPDALKSDGEIWEDYDADYTRDGHLQVTGHSKYEATEAIAAMKELTAYSPEMTITHFTEWDYDENGSESIVYRHGEMVREQSQVSRLAPLDLDKLIAAGRAALEGYDHPLSPSSLERHKHDCVGELRNLLDALDPEGAKK